MKKNKNNKKSEVEQKPSKKEQVLDWLKFLALVLIILPPCTFIFEGFNAYGLIFVGLGVILFVVNLCIEYFIQKKQNGLDNQSQNCSKGDNAASKKPKNKKTTNHNNKK